MSIKFYGLGQRQKQVKIICRIYLEVKEHQWVPFQTLRVQTYMVLEVQLVLLQVQAFHHDELQDKAVDHQVDMVGLATNQARPLGDHAKTYHDSIPVAFCTTPFEQGLIAD